MIYVYRSYNKPRPLFVVSVCGLSLVFSALGWRERIPFGMFMEKSGRKYLNVGIVFLKRPPYICGQTKNRIMRRLSEMICAFLLSLLIIHIGGGIVVVHCLHSGMIKVAHAATHGRADTDCPDNDSMNPSSCMEISIEQLSSSLEATGGSIDLAPVPFLVACLDDWQERQLSDQAIPVYPPVSQGVYLPPKLCLSLYCTLLI